MMHVFAFKQTLTYINLYLLLNNIFIWYDNVVILVGYIIIHSIIVTYSRELFYH